MDNYFGVRKGAWTGEEDKLLRLCIEKHGEGKWHEVPEKAGLNRCRKSCRLRWLNYLKPNINRAEFTEDEVDLIVRLHKLLGNRWSLIAGRLPGRTANDVKNYWNTHLRKKAAASRIEGVSKAKTVPQMVTRTNIFKPQPRAFSKKLLIFGTNGSSLGNRAPEFNDHGLLNSSTSEILFPPLGEDYSHNCWENMLLEVSLGGDTTGNGATDGSSRDEEVPINVDGLWNAEIAPGEKGGVGFFQEWEISWNDLSLDVDIWDMLSAESI